MCLIIASQKASNILESVTRQEIENAADRNDDGVGVMYISGKTGRMVVQKLTPTPPQGKKELTDFILNHLSLARPDKPFAAHLRFTTHGANCDINTHPHRILSMKEDKLGKEIWMMHNGVIRNCGTFSATREGDSETYSDTARFTHLVLRPIALKCPELMGDEALNTLLGEFIGFSSKLCIMDNSGNMFFINESAGTWRKEVWFSTISYINAPYVYHPPRYNNWNNQTGLFEDDNDYKKKKHHLHHSNSNNKHNKTENGKSGIITPISTRIVTLPNYEKEAEQVKSSLANLDKGMIEKIMTGEWEIKEEPNFNNKALVYDVEQGILYTQMMLNNNRAELAKFFSQCPVDAAEQLYYILKQFFFDGENLKHIWKKSDPNGYIAGAYDKLRNCNYKELVEKSLDTTERERVLDVYAFLTKEFEYPWQEEFLKQRNNQQQ